MHASRFPVRGGLTLAFLVAYALFTELLQGPLPSRTVEFVDLLENLLGLGAGTAIWSVIQKRPDKRSDISTSESDPSDPVLDKQEESSSAEPSVVESRPTTG